MTNCIIRIIESKIDIYKHCDGKSQFDFLYEEIERSDRLDDPGYFTANIFKALLRNMYWIAPEEHYEKTLFSQTGFGISSFENENIQPHENYYEISLNKEYLRQYEDGELIADISFDEIRRIKKLAS